MAQALTIDESLFIFPNDGHTVSPLRQFIKLRGHYFSLQVYFRRGLP